MLEKATFPDSGPCALIAQTRDTKKRDKATSRLDYFQSIGGQVGQRFGPSMGGQAAYA
jgi:hypothetical protein